MKFCKPAVSTWVIWLERESDLSHTFDDFRLDLTKSKGVAPWLGRGPETHSDSTWKYLKHSLSVPPINSLIPLHYLSLLTLKCSFPTSQNLVPQIHFVWTIQQHPIELQERAMKNQRYVTELQVEQRCQRWFWTKSRGGQQTTSCSI